MTVFQQPIGILVFMLLCVHVMLHFHKACACLVENYRKHAEMWNARQEEHTLELKQTPAISQFWIAA